MSEGSSVSQQLVFVCANVVGLRKGNVYGLFCSFGSYLSCSLEVALLFLLAGC